MRLRRSPFLGITDKMKSVRVWYRFLSCGKKTTWTPSDVLGGDLSRAAEQKMCRNDRAEFISDSFN